MYRNHFTWKKPNQMAAVHGLPQKNWKSENQTRVETQQASANGVEGGELVYRNRSIYSFELSGTFPESSAAIVSATLVSDAVRWVSETLQRVDDSCRHFQHAQSVSPTTQRASDMSSIPLEVSPSSHNVLTIILSFQFKHVVHTSWGVANSHEGCRRYFRHVQRRQRHDPNYQ